MDPVTFPAAMTDDPIPFVNLERQLAPLQQELAEAMQAVVAQRAFIQGPFVQKFEAEFARAMGVEVTRVAACSNGTSALTLALKGLGVGPGDEVITVAQTFMATAEAILNVGATPVFVDVVGNGHYGMDPTAVEGAITPATRALLPVHLYGMPCHMSPLLELARQRGLWVIEDGAQAHLAETHGHKVGTLGDAGAFSFFPGKNLGACGDAGLVMARDPMVVARMRALRDHGRGEKYIHHLVGDNMRMDGLQGAVLSVKLPHLQGWSEARRRAAARYDARLRPAGFTVLNPTPHTLPVYHLYVVEVSNRARVMAHLQAHGIGHGIHYPLPLHRQPALAHLPKRHLPVTEAVAQRILSLPICDAITGEEIDRVVEVFLSVARP